MAETLWELISFSNILIRHLYKPPVYIDPNLHKLVRIKGFKNQWMWYFVIFVFIIGAGIGSCLHVINRRILHPLPADTVSDLNVLLLIAITVICSATFLMSLALIIYSDDITFGLNELTSLTQLLRHSTFLCFLI